MVQSEILMNDDGMILDSDYGSKKTERISTSSTDAKIRRILFRDYQFVERTLHRHDEFGEGGKLVFSTANEQEKSFRSVPPVAWFGTDRLVQPVSCGSLLTKCAHLRAANFLTSSSFRSHLPSKLFQSSGRHAAGLGWCRNAKDRARALPGWAL